MFNLQMPYYIYHSVIDCTAEINTAHRTNISDLPLTQTYMDFLFVMVMHVVVI